MSTKKLQIVTPIVTSVNGETGDVVVATTEELNTKQSKTITDTGNYFTTDTVEDALQEIGADYAKKSEIPDVSGYQTEAQVQEQISTHNTAADAHSDIRTEVSTLNTLVSGKVDKVDGKGLSTNDYTTDEKNKLAGIEARANNYSLPVATSTSLGGVKSGTDITVDSSGNVSVNDDSHNHIISNIDNLQSTLDSKVDSVDGKGLSTNDYTTAEKNKLAGIDTGANKTIVDSELSSTSTNPVQNKVVNTALDGKSNTSHTHTLNNLDGTLGASKGGTGADLSGAAANAVVCKASSGQNLATVSTAKGAFYATGANGTPKFGTLPIAEGGTGATSASAARTNLGFTHGTAEPTGTPSTGNGAVYFMEDDGTPLPIAEGGTGASTAANARANLQLKFLNVTPTFSTTNNLDANNSGGNLAVLPGLRLAIFRCGVVTKKQFSAGYTYNIASVPDEYVPTSSFGLGAYSTDGTLCARLYATDKVVHVNIKDTVASGSSIYISGIWYY